MYVRRRAEAAAAAVHKRANKRNIKNNNVKETDTQSQRMQIIHAVLIHFAHVFDRVQTHAHTCSAHTPVESKA